MFVFGSFVTKTSKAKHTAPHPKMSHTTTKQQFQKNPKKAPNPKLNPFCFSQEPRLQQDPHYLQEEQHNQSLNHYWNKHLVWQ